MIDEQQYTVGYTTGEYAREVWHGAVSRRTVQRWCEDGKDFDPNATVKKLPSGQYRIFVCNAEKNEVESLVALMEA